MDDRVAHGVPHRVGAQAAKHRQARRKRRFEHGIWTDAANRLFLIQSNCAALRTRVWAVRGDRCGDRVGAVGEVAPVIPHPLSVGAQGEPGRAAQRQHPAHTRTAGTAIDIDNGERQRIVERARTAMHGECDGPPVALPFGSHAKLALPHLLACCAPDHLPLRLTRVGGQLRGGQ